MAEFGCASGALNPSVADSNALVRSFGCDWLDEGEIPLLRILAVVFLFIGSKRCAFPADACKILL